ncbi:hypothetical protein Ahy_B05g076334 [Arachis hypogaea]|uniref:Uncharacterized protein n=1 Tax=Arachis hypogaea TaxID=3818 RepID=A0A444Z341_ARAHY|nr:hypothetical protein Ahy_B05g076334 [Arachis hypogaea]
MLEDVCEHRDHFTIWFRPDIKKALYVYWETDEGFKRHGLMNRANKVSARSSKYTGGSATFIKTKARLCNLLDRDATMVETFKSSTQRLEASTQQSQCTRDDGKKFAASAVDLQMDWGEAASEPYKNCVFGLGSFFANNLHTSTLRQSSVSATSHPVDLEDGVDFREQVLLLTWSLHQQAQQLQESEERYQAILSCMIDTDDFMLEWRRELGWLQRTERQMVVY